MLISQTTFEKFKINQNLSLPLDNQSYISDLKRYKMYNWLSTVNDKFWLILNYSKVVWDIDTKFLPVVVIISFQLSTKFGVPSLTQNGFPAKTISNFKRAWQAHFLSHTYETQEICCFLADVQIILVSLFEFFDYIKAAKIAGAFLSRCSELLDLPYYIYQKQSHLLTIFAARGQGMKLVINRNFPVKKWKF